MLTTPTTTLWQNPATMWPAAPATWDFFTVDIETADGDPDEAERLVMASWRPSSLTGEKAWTDETAGRKLKEAMERRKKKLALLDSSPIIVVSIKSSTGELVVLHCMEQHGARHVEGTGGGLAAGFSTEEEMLTALRSLWDTRCTAETVVQGYNILGFDLPKLRAAFMRYRLRLPMVLSGTSQEVFDAARAFRLFTTDSRDTKYTALDVVLEKFGLDSHKGLMSGAEVPRRYEAGEYEAILTYAFLDVAREHQLCGMMRGTWEGLK